MGRNCDPNEPLCIPMGAETDPNTIRTVPHAPRCVRNGTKYAAPNSDPCWVHLDRSCIPLATDRQTHSRWVPRNTRASLVYFHGPRIDCRHGSDERLLHHMGEQSRRLPRVTSLSTQQVHFSPDLSANQSTREANIICPPAVQSPTFDLTRRHVRNTKVGLDLPLPNL